MVLRSVQMLVIANYFLKFLTQSSPKFHVPISICQLDKCLLDISSLTCLELKSWYSSQTCPISNLPWVRLWQSQTFTACNHLWLLFFKFHWLFLPVWSQPPLLLAYIITMASWWVFLLRHLRAFLLPGTVFPAWLPGSFLYSSKSLPKYQGLIEPSSSNFPSPLSYPIFLSQLLSSNIWNNLLIVFFVSKKL